MSKVNHQRVVSHSPLHNQNSSNSTLFSLNPPAEEDHFLTAKNFKMNSKEEWQEGPPKLKRVGPTTCGYCSVTFPSTNALRAHKLKKIDDENKDRTGGAVHLWCEICDRDFHTLGGIAEHLRQVRDRMRILHMECAWRQRL